MSIPLKKITNTEELFRWIAETEHELLIDLVCAYMLKHGSNFILAEVAIPPATNLRSIQEAGEEHEIPASMEQLTEEVIKDRASEFSERVDRDPKDVCVVTDMHEPGVCYRLKGTYFNQVEK